MAPKKPTTDETEPATVDYVIGTNKGHAERHISRTRKYPKAKALAVNNATPQLLEGKTVVLARDPADRAANWADLETYGCTIVK